MVGSGVGPVRRVIEMNYESKLIVSILIPSCSLYIPLMVNGKRIKLETIIIE